MLFRQKKMEFLEKSTKSTFSKGVSPLFPSKNRSFYHLCFLGKSSQKRSFFDILDKKECFLDRKKELFKSPKKSNFSKGVRLWFLSKNRTFYHLCFFANQARQDRFLTFWINKDASYTRKRKF